MAITPVPSMTDTPPFPALADRAAGTYNSKAFAFGTHMADTFNGEIIAIANNVKHNAEEAQTFAGAASTASSTAVTAADTTTAKAAEAVAARDLAVDYANKIDGAVTGSLFSAKYWSQVAQSFAETLGTMAAFSDVAYYVRNATDATKRMRADLSALATATTIIVSYRSMNGVVAFLSDLARFILQNKYFDSGTVGAINMTNGGHQRWAPPASGTQTFTLAGLGITGEHHELHLYCVGLGSVPTLSMGTTINWYKADGTTVTNFAATGYVLRTGAGVNQYIIWRDDLAGLIYGKQV